ncbi:hypothetical protein CXF68_06125 [Tenacibaculum sp. Bg11-29]|uniref:hypothetical protein n=1 Tax=Tenacibaculum sp. Bg11-29 TaxID=2058306 RepID=UPI000C32356E|nr:hypothetical protein [Tenacibaculum sp. Bg11-29]PKH50300.1 hypothetical protein CXF68_06125 [Tenacibaculum sp. Bg11-29]
MTTDLDVLKETIYEKIGEINDVKVLNAIKTLVDTMKAEVLEGTVTEKRDLTGYIKEWAKNM